MTILVVRVARLVEHVVGLKRLQWWWWAGSGTCNGGGGVEACNVGDASSCEGNCDAGSDPRHCHYPTICKVLTQVFKNVNLALIQ